mmetsp:Transcript_81407/g.263670  ORF Transcript_81407/g.263670 Transcript_81407/m.263670 type:complete len:490 (+) Transcript_81407:354-1823(+)
MSGWPLWPVWETTLWERCSFLGPSGTWGSGKWPGSIEMSWPPPFGPSGPRAWRMSGRNWRSNSSLLRFLSSFCWSSALAALVPLQSMCKAFSWSLISSSCEMSCANFAGETLAAASRLAFSIASRMYLARTTASCSSEEILRMVSCSCCLSASCSASARRKAACACSSSCLVRCSWASVSASACCVRCCSARSSAMAASCCCSRSAAWAAAASSCFSMFLIFRRFCSMVSLAASSCEPSDSTSLCISPTLFSISSWIIRFRASSSSLRARSAASWARRSFVALTSRIQSLKIQEKVMRSPVCMLPAIAAQPSGLSSPKRSAWYTSRDFSIIIERKTLLPDSKPFCKMRSAWRCSSAANALSSSSSNRSHLERSAALASRSSWSSLPSSRWLACASSRARARLSIVTRAMAWCSARSSASCCSWLCRAVSIFPPPSQPGVAAVQPPLGEHTVSTGFVVKNVSAVEPAATPSSKSPDGPIGPAVGHWAKQP